MGVCYTVYMKADIKKRAIRRLQIIEGQVRGLRSMVEKEEYCINIITQSAAVKKGISGVEDLILENHLSTHVIEQVKGGSSSKAVKEVLTVYKIKANN